MWNGNVQNSRRQEIRSQDFLRLPVSHPEYRYSISRNPYAERLRSLEGFAFGDHDCEALRGRWHSMLGSRELCVEIGCNGGHVLLEWARRNPNQAYIGIDWKFKQIFLAAEKAKKRGLKNTVFLRSRAERISYIFAPQEIHQLKLYFPDPWERPSQRKHRFVTRERLLEIAPLVVSGGTFEIKTDHADYFSWISKAVAQVSSEWRVLERSSDLHQGCLKPNELEIPEVTLFEKIFIRKGLPIFRLLLEKV